MSSEKFQGGLEILDDAEPGLRPVEAVAPRERVDSSPSNPRKHMLCVVDRRIAPHRSERGAGVRN